LSKDGKSICLFLKTSPNLNKVEAKNLLNLLDSKKDEYKFDSFHLAGRVLAQTYFVEKMMEELVVFMTSAIFLLFIFLYISFRSWWGIVIPLLVIIVSIIWTLAIMKFTGKSFDLLMVMLPTIIFVVGMSDLVHLLTKYLDELRKGNRKEAALKIAFKEVRWATFITSLTTSIGFFSLVFANILPIKEFGIYAGISVFVAYGLAFSFLPCVLLLVNPPHKLVDSKQDNFWDKYLRKWFLLVLRNKTKVSIITSFLILIGCFTASNIQINNYLLEDLSDSDPIKKDVLYFENNYSGMRPFEAELSSKKKKGVLFSSFLQN
jgi:predicted RND superfamily exporter protein